MRIDNQALGEVIDYARHICFHDNAPSCTNLLLYDKKEFWLIWAVRGAILLIQACRWNAEGSSKILKDFIEEGRSPWIKLLNAACNHWQLSVQADAFLGMGTFGRKFKVRFQNKGRARIMALKLVLPGAHGAGSLELTKEKQALDKASQACPHAVA